MSAVFDRDELLERLDHDWDFLSEMVGLLGTDGRSLLDQIEKASASGDADTISRAAHTLKGMVSNFCAPVAQASALNVEKLTRSGDRTTLPSAIGTLRNDVEELIQALKDLLAARA